MMVTRVGKYNNYLLLLLNLSSILCLSSVGVCIVDEEIWQTERFDELCRRCVHVLWLSQCVCGGFVLPAADGIFSWCGSAVVSR